MPEHGKEETVRVVALDRSFHVDCYRCEVMIFLYSLKYFIYKYSVKMKLFIIVKYHYSKSVGPSIKLVILISYHEIPV